VNRIPATPIRKSQHLRGFTLIEMLIVAILITLFSSLAIFSVQQLYDDARRKTVHDDVKQIGTALHFAYEHIGFIPRIHLLGRPLNEVTFQLGGQTIINPAFDTYGYLPFDPPQVTTVQRKWAGSYIGVIKNRETMSRGDRGLVWMRLPDRDSIALGTVGDLDLSRVKWPADAWGNPFVVYQVTSDNLFITTDNPRGLRLIQRPGELANKITAVVSYGPNGVPGGNENTLTQSPQFIQNVLQPASLFVVGDVTGGDAEFTLKSFDTAIAPVELDLVQFADVLAQSLLAEEQVPGDGQVGMLNPLSDDIYWTF
jgi:prepilin-type N-terminal cleavage/methylation domain-containing protein